MRGTNKPTWAGCILALSDFDAIIVIKILHTYNSYILLLYEIAIIYLKEPLFLYMMKQIKKMLGYNKFYLKTVFTMLIEIQYSSKLSEFLLE